MSYTAGGSGLNNLVNSTPAANCLDRSKASMSLNFEISDSYAVKLR